MGILFFIFSFQQDIHSPFFSSILSALFMKKRIYVKNDILNIIFKNKVRPSTYNAYENEFNGIIDDFITIFNFNTQLIFSKKKIQLRAKKILMANGKNKPKKLKQLIKYIMNNKIDRLKSNIIKVEGDYKKFKAKFDFHVNHIFFYFKNLEEISKHNFFLWILNNFKIRKIFNERINYYEFLFKLYKLELYHNEKIHFFDKKFNMNECAYLLNVILNKVFLEDTYTYYRYYEKINNKIKMVKKTNERAVAFKIFTSIIHFVRKCKLEEIQFNMKIDMRNAFIIIIEKIKANRTLYENLFDDVIFIMSKFCSSTDFFLIYDEKMITYNIILQNENKETGEIINNLINDERVGIFSAADLYYEIFFYQTFFNESIYSRTIISFIYKIMMYDLQSYDYDDFERVNMEIINIIESQRVDILSRAQ